MIEITAHIQNRCCHRWRCFRVVSFKKQKIAAQAAQKMKVPIAVIIGIKNSLIVISTVEPDKMALSYNTSKRKSKMNKNPLMATGAGGGKQRPPAEQKMPTTPPAKKK